MTRADSSNGLIGSATLKNYIEAGKKSSNSIGVAARRCPNLQRLIEQKKI